MWNRKSWFLWFEISKDKGRVYSFPLSLFALTTLLQSILELILVISYLIPGAVARSSETNEVMTMKDVRKVISTVTKIVTILEHQEKFDLIDVETEDTLIKFAIR